ncbi:hypothetical protein FOC4_g10012411 [Fusarium odoratissimum]|uniref:NAD-dependent epimerase/dehydratase domain-containing protein n=1 Tax=Fusarium oxysporum f. sp. cubense (strain race 4) TaxID=2502994 RepID=N1RR10_FUSC4|nr:hypothetical protein FOC4_g10012411 [Fusarium odoratissimum]
MSRNILITGAAGYIGGFIVANLLSKHPETTKQQVFAAVRTDEQAKALSTLGINVLKLDLSDEQAVVNEMSSHKISVIVHAANSINPELALPLINALAKQKESAGKPTHFIHVGSSVDPSMTSAVHISGLTALYCRIIHAALKNEEIPSGKEGYYSAVAHETDMWEFQDHLAAAMKARGLVSSNKPEMYSSDFLDALYKSGGNFTATRPQSIGWKPKWDKERFLKNIDSEIEDVLELGKAKSSLIDSLIAAVGRSH